MLLIIRYFRSKYYKLINLIIFKINKINIGSNYIINGIMYLRNNGNIFIGNNLTINSGLNQNPIGGDIITRILVAKNATFIIGNNVGISNTTFCCKTYIKIDDFVLIGGGCKIWDTDHHSIDYNERMHYGDNFIVSKPIHIEKYVFIGGGVTILKGVTIGQNSIVAAGSIVVKNIPCNEIWGGNPAKFIKKIDTK